MTRNFASETPRLDKNSRQADLLNDTLSMRLLGSWEWEPETDQYFWTDSMFFLHGLSPSSDNHIPVEAAHQMIDPDDFVVFQKYWDELKKTGLANSRFRIITPEGKVKAVHAQGKAILQQDGKYLFRGCFQEEKMELHQYLLDEIQKQQIHIDILEHAEEIAQSGTWQINLSSFETFYSNNIFRLHGVLPGSISSHPDTFMKFIHADDKEIVMNAFERSYHEKIPLHLEYRIVTNDGEGRYLKLVSSIIKNEKGEQLLTGTTHDITEKKLLELALDNSYEKLKVQHELFQQAEQLGSTGTWQINLQTLEIFYSDNVYTIHGLKPQSLLPSPDTFFPFIHPDDREAMIERRQKILQGEIFPFVEFRIIRADGKERTIQQIIKQSKNVAHEPLVLGVIQDVTEQQVTKTQLEEINEKLQLQNESFVQAEKIVSLGSWHWNLDTGKTHYSENIHFIYGLKPGQLPREIEGLSKFVHPEEREVFADMIRRIKGGDSVVENEYRIVLPGGQEHYLRNRNKLIVSPSGQKIVVGTVQDITQETQLRKQLSERIGFAEMLSDTILDTIIVTDAANNIVACNTQCEKAHGFKKHEVFGRNIFNVFPQLKNADMIENFRKAYQGKTIHIPAAKSVLAKGYHDLLMRPLKNKEDETAGVLVLVHDVTAEYELQQQLKERVSFIEKLVESSVDRIMALDINLNYIIWNQNCEKYYGIKKDEIIGKNVLERFPMFKTDPIYQDCKRALKGETIHIPAKKNDAYSYSESFLVPIKDEKDQVTGILWVMHDLTEIMEAREKLLVSEIGLKTAQAIAHVGSWEYDHESQVFSWSDEVFRMYGYEPQAFEPSVDFFLLTSHPDHRSNIQKLLSTDATYKFTNRIYTLDGHVRYIETIGHPASIGSNAPSRIVGTMQDVTEQRNLHEQLKEKTKAIRNQYELARQAELIRNVSTWQWDVETGNIFWSENLFKILGFAPYSFLPDMDRFLSLVHPDDKAIMEEAIQSIAGIDNGTFPVLEFRLFDRNGEIKYVRTGGRVETTKTGKHVTGTFLDITDFVLLKQQLKRNEEALQAVIDFDNKGIGFFDHDLNCIAWNKRLAEIYGKSGKEAVGKYLFDLIPTLQEQPFESQVKKLKKENAAASTESLKFEADNSTIEIMRVGTGSVYETALMLQVTSTGPNQ